VLRLALFQLHTHLSLTFHVNAQVELIVTQMPRCNQVAISDFRDKQDLINVAMTSAHVPWLLNGCLTRSCRGVASMDGERQELGAGRLDLGQLGPWPCHPRVRAACFQGLMRNSVSDKLAV
jgi:hypothetical protein